MPGIILCVCGVSNWRWIGTTWICKTCGRDNQIACNNPECPEAGKCGGECARNF